MQQRRPLATQTPGESDQRGEGGNRINYMEYRRDDLRVTFSTNRERPQRGDTNSHDSADRTQATTTKCCTSLGDQDNGDDDKGTTETVTETGGKRIEVQVQVVFMFAFWQDNSTCIPTLNANWQFDSHLRCCKQVLCLVVATNFLPHTRTRTLTHTLKQTRARCTWDSCNNSDYGYWWWLYFDIDNVVVKL